MQIALELATNAVEKVEDSKLQEDYELALKLVDNLVDGHAKKELSDRLEVVKNAMDKALAEEVATAAVVKAESTKAKSDYDSAKALVDALVDDEVKLNLSSRLDAVKATIDKALADQEATSAVEKAERTKAKSDYNSAKALVNALEDGQVKTNLLERLVAVKADIDKALVEQEATNAVGKAERTKAKADYDSAKVLVDALKGGNVKISLSKRLVVVKNEIDRAVELVATTAVEKAENSNLQKDYNSAKELVDALHEGVVKNKLSDRLVGVRNTIDVATVKAALIVTVNNPISDKPNLNLASETLDTTIIWSSDNTDRLSNDGIVVRDHKISKGCLCTTQL